MIPPHVESLGRVVVEEVIRGTGVRPKGDWCQTEVLVFSRKGDWCQTEVLVFSRRDWEGLVSDRGISLFPGD
jgi:hypothetical protein